MNAFLRLKHCEITSRVLVGHISSLKNKQNISWQENIENIEKLYSGNSTILRSSIAPFVFILARPTLSLSEITVWLPDLDPRVPKMKVVTEGFNVGNFNWLLASLSMPHQIPWAWSPLSYSLLLLYFFFLFNSECSRSHDSIASWADNNTIACNTAESTERTDAFNKR